MCDITIYNGPTPFHNLRAALDALPEKKLSKATLIDQYVEVGKSLPCALGAFLMPYVDEVITHGRANGKEAYFTATELLNKNLAEGVTPLTEDGVYSYNDGVKYTYDDDELRRPVTTEERFKIVYAWADHFATMFDQRPAEYLAIQAQGTTTFNLFRSDRALTPA